MKKQSTGIIVIAAVLVVIVAGAVIAYNFLSERVGVDTPLVGSDGHIHLPGRPHDHDSHDDYDHGHNGDEEANHDGEEHSESGPAENGEAQDDDNNGDGLTEAGGEAEYDEERILAPDFTVQDIEYGEVRLSDYIGTPVVLSFWTSWCGACSAQMPGFNEVYKEVGDSVRFMMVNLVDGARETRTSGLAYVLEHGYSFPIYFDIDREAAIAYAVRSIPATFFIDAEGVAIAHAVGMIGPETLRTAIDMITDG